MEKKMKINKKLTAAMGAVAALFGSVAHAQTNGSVTGDFKVSTTVAASCVLDVQNIDIGDFTASTTGVTTASGSLSVTCSGNLPYTVSFNSASGSNTEKKLGKAGSTDKLAYSLKTTHASATFETGTTAGNIIDVTLAQNTGAKMTFPLAVELSNNQYVSPGAYKDTITATLSY